MESCPKIPMINFDLKESAYDGSSEMGEKLLTVIKNIRLKQINSEIHFLYWLNQFKSIFRRISGRIRKASTKK